MLFDEGPIAAGVLPVAALRDYLRLGTGFADDGLQDGLLEGHLRAALAVVEARTAKAVLARPFRLVLEGWREAGAQPLPIAPVAEVTEVALVPETGAPVVVAPARWRLVADAHRPRLVAAGGGHLPAVPTGGRVEVRFTAGFAPVWSGVPADLREAVLGLAATYYERRLDGLAEAPGMPARIEAILSPWRTVRLLGGGAG
jgi:uncharacterized phiE125 gp8 family phage protein